MPDQQHEQHEQDDGITASARDGIRLPKSVAQEMAPASKWLVYAVAVTCVIYGICLGVARIIEATK